MASEAVFACGRCLHLSVPEDSFDRQPERSGDGRFALVADLRLDNRDEIGSILGRTIGESAELSDSRLVFDLLIAKGERALDWLLGDFAFAFWDSREQTLRLARDPLGERPLHVARSPHGVKFASMPQALARGLGADVDDDRLACLVADLPAGFTGSFFKGVQKVEPGQILTVTAAGLTARTYWDPLGRPTADYRGNDFGEALREQLDASVARRLRRVRGGVAAHLSSGLDSSAVATSAAIQLRGAGQTLHAFTSAPLSPPSSAPAGWHTDESGIAAATAALHPNIEHHVVRDMNRPFDLAQDHALAGQPVGSVLNNAWWSRIDAQASAAGATVLLTGEVGNFTISAGLVWDDLAQLLRGGDVARWWSETRALARQPGGWRTALGTSLAPLLPPGLANAYARARGAREFERTTYLNPQRREQIERQARHSDWEALSRFVGVRRRLAFLRMADPGAFRKRSLARWGIEERDATADRRLVEFCFSLPVEARLRDGVRRPALRQAIEGRVAPEVLASRTRGLQSADWPSRLSRDEVAEFARSVRTPASETMLDWAAVEATIARWPSAPVGNTGQVYEFTSLLRALSAAHFQASFEHSFD